jgi:hypothetical protein
VDEPGERIVPERRESHMRTASSSLVAPIGLALVATAAVLALQLFVFQGDTITSDENSYLFQARLLASGRTWIEPPPERNLAQFPSSMINLTHRRWFSRYTVGHPLALVPGVLAGHAWLIPLVFSGISVFLVYLAARLFYDEATAVVAAALTALSPFYIAMHATLLSHTTSLLCLALFVVACARLVESRNIGWGFVAGTSLGYMFNTRPYTTGLTAWPFLAWIAWRLVQTRSVALLRQCIALSAAATVFCAAYFGYNNLTTGSWRVSPYSYYNPSETLGFGPVMISDYVHTPERGLRQTLRSVQRLNHWWLGFNASLWVLVGLLLSKWSWREIVLASSAVSLVAGYLFFWFGGISTVGPVYYFEALVPLALLGAHSLVTLWRKWPWGGEGGRRVRGWVATSAVVAWCGLLVAFFRSEVPDWNRFFSDQRALEAAVGKVKPGRAIVFLETGGDVWNAVQYDPRAPLDIIYVRSRPRSDERVMAQNPGREIYRYHDKVLQRVR